MFLSASSQAPAWEFGVGSSSFPCREAATAWTDILLHAKSAFPTSLWIMQEVESRREQRSRATQGAVAESFGNWVPNPEFGNQRNPFYAHATCFS
jgi:hypothetical protein